MCKATRGSRKRSHIFSTFFLERLLRTDGAYQFDNVKRWTKNFNIFAMKYIFFPDCEGHHWNLFKVDMELKEISCFDSLFPVSMGKCRAILRCVQSLRSLFITCSSRDT